MKDNILEISDKLSKGELTEKGARSLLLSLFGVSNSWLSPVDSEKEWQEKHIKKIWQGYPNICPNWQILNGLIRYACENFDIEVTEP